MSKQEIKELELWIHKNVFKADGFVGLKKRGLWYRPNACGYTDRQEEAGRYTLEEAKKHEHADDVPVTIHEFDVPKYASKPAPAFEVFKKILETHEEPKFYKLLSEEVFSVTAIGDGCCTLEEGQKIQTQAETLELAICQFAKQIFTKS